MSEQNFILLDRAGTSTPKTKKNFIPLNIDSDSVSNPERKVKWGEKIVIAFDGKPVILSHLKNYSGGIFLERAWIVHGVDRYDYSITDFESIVDGKSRIIFFCNSCRRSMKKTVKQHIGNKNFSGGCRKCYGSHKNVERETVIYETPNNFIIDGSLKY